MRLRGSKLPERRSDADAIMLANGDVLTGFVESIGTDLAYEPLAGGAADPAASEGDASMESSRRVSLDRIGAVVFAAAGTTDDASMQLTTKPALRAIDVWRRGLELRTRRPCACVDPPRRHFRQCRRQCHERRAGSAAVASSRGVRPARHARS
jgi:hypothetical protein